jgi:hypothetical protein
MASTMRCSRCFLANDGASLMRFTQLHQALAKLLHRTCAIEIADLQMAIAVFSMAILTACTDTGEPENTAGSAQADSAQVNSIQRYRANEPRGSILVEPPDNRPVTAVSDLSAAVPNAIVPSVSEPSPSVPNSTESIASVSAGPDKILTLPATIVDLPGSAIGGQAEWTQLGGPSAVVFKSTSTAVTSVAADKPGIYRLQLALRDAAGVVKTSSVSITVKPNPTVLSATSTPLDHLKSRTRPVFKQGHTLLPLSVSSCGMAPEISVELMRHWGYTARIDTVNNGLVAQEVRASPGRYPVEVALGNLYTIDENFDGKNPSLPILPAQAYLQDETGAFILNGGRRLISPEAPDAVVNLFADHVGRAVAAVEASLNQPIKLIQNSGEYGVWHFGDGGSQYYRRDPKVWAAYLASGLSLQAYNSREKARHERLIKEGIYNKLKKDRPIYNVYQESYGGERGRWFGWPNYNFLIEQFFTSDGRPMVSDYSSPEMYYKNANSGWTGVNGGSMVPWDGLTQALRNIGGTIKLGQRHVYPWVSAGWDTPPSGGISDNDLFMGFMKSFYTLGALGATSGYFTCEGPNFAAMYRNQTVGTAIPTQINGLYLVSQTHALFSHLEEYLWNGDLLSGVGDHPYKSIAEVTPSMEFPAVGETAQLAGSFGPVTVRTARVLARKIKNEDRWLISAWANTGVDREVRVTIDPKLGELKLNARRSGSIYIAAIKDGVRSLKLVDEDGMNPTHGLFP